MEKRREDELMRQLNLTLTLREEYRRAAADLVCMAPMLRKVLRDGNEWIRDQQLPDDYYPR